MACPTTCSGGASLADERAKRDSNEDVQDPGVSSLSRDAFHRHDRPPGAGALVPRSSNPDVPVNREDTSVVQRLRSTDRLPAAAAPGRLDVAIDRSTPRLP